MDELIKYALNVVNEEIEKLRTGDAGNTKEFERNAKRAGVVCDLASGLIYHINKYETLSNEKREKADCIDNAIRTIKEQIEFLRYMDTQKVEEFEMSILRAETIFYVMDRILSQIA